MRHRLWLVAALVAVAGCGGGGTGGTSRNLFVGGAVPNVSHIYRIQLNTGISGVVLGTDAGYFITGSNGGSYRLVWTGDANSSQVYRSFTGSVFTPGHFLNKVDGCDGNSCSLKVDDRISVIHDTSGGQRIDFDTIAANDLVGFDFVVDTEPVLFNFFMDGHSYPSLVHFPATDNGGAVSPVDVIPFGLVSQ